jgi:hypothetical protein
MSGANRIRRVSTTIWFGLVAAFVIYIFRHKIAGQFQPDPLNRDVLLAVIALPVLGIIVVSWIFGGGRAADAVTFEWITLVIATPLIAVSTTAHRSELSGLAQA